jgi:hypothetical protein
MNIRVILLCVAVPSAWPSLARKKNTRAPEGDLLAERVCHSFSSVGFFSGVSSLQSCASVA